MNKEKILLKKITKSYDFVSEDGVEEKFYFHFKGDEKSLERFKEEFPNYKIFGGFTNGKFTIGRTTEWYADIPLSDPIVPILKEIMLENLLKEVKIKRHQEIIKYLSKKFDTFVIEDWNDSATNPSPVYRPVFEGTVTYIYDYTKEIELKIPDDEIYLDINTPKEEIEQLIKKVVIEA